MPGTDGQRKERPICVMFQDDFFIKAIRCTVSSWQLGVAVIREQRTEWRFQGPPRAPPHLNESTYLKSSGLKLPVLLLV